ncbi:protein DVR-1 [Carassius gibelio]|uniref:protein DVR-1 n=1 Tax=Carassius gibelio TaxID=101364 RepID=UPI002278CEB9|nr:protein DVR-1 [Carassius gibelio]
MLVLEDVEQLSFAQLEMKLKQDLAHLGPHVFSVDLYRVLRTTLKGVTQDPSRKLLLSQSLGPGAHASVHVNLTDLTETWRKPGKNYGMHVELQQHASGACICGKHTFTAPNCSDARVVHISGGGVIESVSVRSRRTRKFEWDKPRHPADTGPFV